MAREEARRIAVNIVKLPETGKLASGARAFVVGAPGRPVFAREAAP